MGYPYLWKPPYIHHPTSIRTIFPSPGLASTAGQQTQHTKVGRSVLLEPHRRPLRSDFLRSLRYEVLCDHR